MGSRLSLEDILKAYGVFRNVFSALFEFKVLGSDRVEVTCRDGYSFTTDYGTFRELLFLVGGGEIKGCQRGALLFREPDGIWAVPLSEVEVADGGLRTVTLGLGHGWRYNIERGYWWKGPRFRHLHWGVLETFDLGQYSRIDVRGRQVIDVGAYVGDSPIYFALRGASRVVAVEPNPRAFLEMVDNLALNHLEEAVTPLNVGVSYSGQSVKVSSSGVTGGEWAVASEGGSVPARTLAQLVRETGVRTDVLKMDCEGCEYDVILRDTDIVARFERLVFEYHAYNVGLPPEALLERLRPHFSCELINSDLYARYFNDWRPSLIGMYYCVSRR